MYRHRTNYPAIHDFDKAHLILFNIPRIVFQWFYSFSLLLFVIFTVLFIAVTPIDVIAQTSGANLSGLKVFIVIGLCVLFIIVAFIIYLLRIFQNRVALQEIPIKGIYILGKDDMPNRCHRMVDKTWTWCSEVSVQATPLNNEAIIINHPGRSPPLYVQKRNKSPIGEGTLFPPDACYEDVIRSLSDRLRFDSRIIGTTVPSMHLTFKEMLIHVIDVYDIRRLNEEIFEEMKQLITLYEKFKFGPNLIEEGELMSFMLMFDKVARYLQANYIKNGDPIAERAEKRDLRSNKNSVTWSVLQPSLGGSQLQSYLNFGGLTDFSIDHKSERSRSQGQDMMVPSLGRHTVPLGPNIPTFAIDDPSETDSLVSFYPKGVESDGSGSVRRGSGSVRRGSGIIRKARDDDSVNKDPGYDTDNEDEDEEDTHGAVDKVDFYSFRRRRPGLN